MEITPVARQTLDPVTGELHYDGGMMFLTRLQAKLLVIPMKAEGEAVPPEAVQDLTRAVVNYADPGARRRAMVHVLRARLRTLGLDIEHCNGFGYRLRGEIQFRVMPEVAL